MDNLFLQFEVRGQEIRRSDTHKLFSGSRNFVKAHFTFDNYWSGVTKYAQYTASGTTYTVEIANDESIVPWEVLHAPNTFEVSVFGGDLITANIVKVYVEESGLRDGELPTEPSPGYFQSIVEEVKESESTAKYYKEAAQVAAQQTDADREAVAADKQTVLEGLTGFTDSTLPEAIQAVAEQADRAEGEADKSTSQASKSESYAVGGTGTRPGEDTDNSKHYSGISLQAMTDLLAMLGSDIATLTDGKLTPSQIPPLSINDVFPVASEAELLALTAERGDCGIIVVDNVVTDSYILAADDPAQLENWKKLGVSYVANAGHASTADNAVNADKINNKRMVAMTQSQYDTAVIDPDTIYIVTPDGV